MIPTALTCAGRFTLQLPVPFEQGIDPNVFNAVQIRWMDLKGKDLDQLWQEYVDRLRTEQGPSPLGSRVLSNYALSGRHAVFYRYAPSAESPYPLETWTVVGDKVLQTSLDGHENDLPKLEQITLTVLHYFVPSNPQGTPSPGAGFCIQGGVIQLPPDNGEQISAHWNLPSNYELQLDSAVVSSPYTVTLIEKARKAALESAVTPSSHATLVRATHRTLLGMDGQETVLYTRTGGDSTTYYNADFMFAGVIDKGSKPGWHLHMSAYDRPGQKVDEAAFITIWDEVLRTISMRLQD